MSGELRARREIEVIQELFRLFGDGRLNDTLELMDPEVILREPGDASVVPWAGEFRGHKGVQAFYAGLAAGLSTVDIDPDSLQFMNVDGGRVLTLGTERGTAKGTGQSYVTESAWLWTVVEGRITELSAFHDTAAMSRALGG